MKPINDEAKEAFALMNKMVDKANKANKERYLCETCGVELYLKNKDKHDISKKHIKNIEKSSKLGTVKE